MDEYPVELGIIGKGQKSFRILSALFGKNKNPKGALLMKLTDKEYQSLYEKASPNSKWGQNCLWAFFVGGAICAVGQMLCNLYVMLGEDLSDARTWVSLSLVLFSALLTAFQVYDNLAKRAGAGTLVPITGFANSIVSPAIEFKSEGFVTGMGAKMFVIAGPVLVYGTVASAVYGLILVLFHLY
jgi:stage V sporulation protein AC